MNQNNKNNKPKLYHGRAPVTRREFLASGAIPFMASVTMPSMLTLFANAGLAQAQELCKVAGVAKLAPIVTINLNGGAGITRNWVALTEGRELLPKYHKMGLGTGNNLSAMLVGHNAGSKIFKNLVPFYSGSGFLAGMQQSLMTTVPTTAADTLSNTTFLGMPQQSQNDSDSNKFDVSGLVGKAGLKGKILPNMGRVDNGIGVSNSTAFVMPSAPLIVNNYDNIVNALGVADRLKNLTPTQQTALFKTSLSLSEYQSRKLASMTGGNVLSGLLSSANTDNAKLIENPSGLDLDPRNNTAFAAVWGLNANTAKTSNDYVNAALVYNAINGNAGSIGIELGGYDYHGSDLATTNAMDTAAGVVMGKVLQSFHVMKSPGFLVVNSDGGVGAPASDTPGADPTADRGDAGAVLMFGYDPTNTVTSSDSQVGHMKNDPDAEAADDRFLVGANPEMGAAAVFANYLSFNGKLGIFTSIPETNRAFGAADLDKIVKMYGKG